MALSDAHHEDQHAACPNSSLPCPCQSLPRACDLARPAPLARPAGAREQPAPDPGLSRGGRRNDPGSPDRGRRATALSPFSVHLDQTGWFQRAKAAWVGPGEWPNELTVLARALRRHGEKLGLGNGEQGYRPTSPCRARRARPPASCLRRIFLLRADRFCLYQSVSTPDGVHYEPLACWPCGPASKTAPRGAHPMIFDPPAVRAADLPLQALPDGCGARQRRGDHHPLRQYRCHDRLRPAGHPGLVLHIRQPQAQAAKQLGNRREPGGSLHLRQHGPCQPDRPGAHRTGRSRPWQAMPGCAPK